MAMGKGWVLPGYKNVLESLDRELNRMHKVTNGLVGNEEGKIITAEDYMKKWE